MKNKIIHFLLLPLILMGCNEDFLDLNPISQANVGNFYKTQEDMTNAVWGVYDILQRDGIYGFSMMVAGENRSDNVTNTLKGQSYSDFDDFVISTNNSIINNLWNTHYAGIYRANVVLGRIDNVPMDEALKNRYVAEVKFLRGLMYFNLVRIFGDVPLAITEPVSIEEGYGHGRVPTTQVYQQILQDLSEAAQVLPVSYGGNDIGRATMGAALALLGKVYLTIQDFQSASTTLKKVIDLGVYELLPDYAALWDPANANHAESIFEIQYKKGGLGEGSRYPNDAAPRQSAAAVVEIGGGQGIYIPESNMIDTYETGDPRKETSLAEGYTSEAGDYVPDPYILKLIEQPFQVHDSDINWTVLRYADVLLMYAEALNELSYEANGEAFTYLNMVRARVGLPFKTSDHTDPDLRISDQAAFRLAIDRERRVELAFEGHRWFDLVRTERYMEVMNARGYIFTVEEYHKLYPIPQSQIDINPDVIMQNPGYGI